MIESSNSRETVFDQVQENAQGATRSKGRRQNFGSQDSGRADSGANVAGEIENLSERAVLEDWIDGQDVMLKLHISRRTLQTLRSNGTVPYSRIGNKIYYLRQDIERILCDNYIMYKLRERYGKDI